MLQKVTDALLAMIDKPGVHFANVEQFINVGLKEFEIKITAQVQQRFRRVRQLYIRSLRDHLLQRFPNIKLLGAFASLFDPSLYPKTDVELRSHGLRELKIICQQFGVDKTAAAGETVDSSRVEVDAAAEASADDAGAADPWDNPDFKLPDVPDEPEDVEMEMEDAGARAGKDSKEHHRLVKSLVNQDDCVGELHGFRNWLLSTNSEHLKAQIRAGHNTADAQSLAAAQKQDAANRAQAAANRAGKSQSKPPDGGSGSGSGSKTNPVVVESSDVKDGDRKSPAAPNPDRDAKSAAAQSDHKLRNMTMTELLLAFLNDASARRSHPHIAK
jgi:hypothetical protein